MKNFSLLFLTIFLMSAFVSCGGEESIQEENGSDGRDIAFSLRAVRTDDCNDTGIACIVQHADTIAFNIMDGLGNPVLDKPFSIATSDLKHQTEINGIKNVDNATLIVSALDSGTQKWTGSASSLKFESGETVTVDIQLYPIAPSAKELDMPEKPAYARLGHTATLLGDDRILLAGGFGSCGANGKCQATDTVEIIDIESGKIETLEPLKEKRAMHTAILMGEYKNTVVFIGGVQNFDSNKQETGYDGGSFQALPYTQTTPVMTVEQYTPKQPKHNMKQNGFGNAVDTIQKEIDVNVPFKIMQSILVHEVSSNEAEVFVVGGVDAEEKPSKKSYKFTLTLDDNGDVHASEVTELAESSEPMLLPALAYYKGSVFALGGRPQDSEYAASLISKDKSEDRYQNGRNLFFTNSIVLENSLYTFGGFVSTHEDGIKNSGENFIIKWSLNEDSASEGKYYLHSKDESFTVSFAETVYDEKNNNFIVIGGTNASNLYQVINASNLTLLTDSTSSSLPTTHVMPDNRVMPKAVIVPTKKIMSKPIRQTPMIMITGGSSSFSESSEKNIKINNL